MDITEESISNDIKNILKSKNIPWMKPIIRNHPKETNPFLQDDLQDLNESQFVINSDIGRLFCSPGCEMEINFYDESRKTSPNSNEFKTSAEVLRGIARAFSKPSISQSKEVSQMFYTGIIAHPSNTKSTVSFSVSKKTLTKSVTIALKSFGPNVTEVKMIEPIIGSFFIYSGKEKKIISDCWNIVPPSSVPLFDIADIHTQNCDTATFLVDPRIKTDNPYFMLLLSHPLTTDNGQAISKYYLSPNQQSEQAAINKLHTTFPKINNYFSTFGCAFVQFSDLENKTEFQMVPYLLDGPLPEKEIHDFISDAKKFKQLPFSIFFNILEVPTGKEKPLIVRPIYHVFSQPQLAPIHDLVVRIDSLSTSIFKSKKVNLVVSLSLIDSDQNKFVCIRSKFASSGFVNESFSRAFHHSKNPDFDDSFLIRLPHPTSLGMSLQFKVYHGHLKKPEKGLSLIGTATIPLFVNKHLLFIEDGEHSAHIQEENSKTDKSMKITFSTFLRSNMVINNKDFQIFALNKGKILKSISDLPTQIVVFNFMFILDKILKSYSSEKEISFTSFIQFRDNALKIMDGAQLDRYLNLFVRYFAFKDSTPKRSVDAKENIDIDLTVGTNKLSKSSESFPSLSMSEPPIDLTPQTSDTVPSSPLTPISSFDSLLQTQQTESMPLSVPPPSIRKPSKSFIIPNMPTASTGSVEKTLHNSSSWYELNKIQPVPKDVKSVGPTDTTSVTNISLIDFCDINTKKNESIPIYVKLIVCFTRTIEANGLFYMDYLIDFIFSLLIKAFSMHSKLEYIQEFDIFIKVYAKKAKEDLINIKKYSRSMAIFSNLLFDIHLSTMATKVTKLYLTEFLSSPDTYSVAVQYISYAFRPSLFYFSVKFVSDFKSCVFKIIEISFKNVNLYGIFDKLIQLLANFNEEMSCDVASALLPCISKVKTNQLSTTTDTTSLLLFLNFLLEHSSTTALKEFCNSLSDMKILFDLCHFLLDKAKTGRIDHVRKLLVQRVETCNNLCHDKIATLKPIQRPRRETIKARSSQIKMSTENYVNTNASSKQSMIDIPIPTSEELANSTTQSLLKFAKNFISVADLNGAFNLLSLSFHMMNNKAFNEAIFSDIMSFLSTLFLSFAPGIFHATDPCIVRVIEKLLFLVIENKNQEEIFKPIYALFEADFKTSNNIDIANSFLTRSLGILDKKEFTNPLICSFMEYFGQYQITNGIYKMFNNLRDVSKYLVDSKSYKISDELLRDYHFVRFLFLRGSPDSQFEALNDLYEMHSKEQSYHEMINVCILQAVLIMEFLTVNGRMPLYFGEERPTQLWIDEYPFLSLIGDAKVLKVPSFADSANFNEDAIIAILYKAINVCIQSKLYNRAMFIIDLVWPMLEQRRLYSQLSYFFGKYENIFNLALNTPKVTNPFFKVSFYGTVFLKENGYTFIYRAKELTNLFEFADSIINKYKQISPESTFELISDSDVVDVTKLEPNKNYIQVTFVEPYKPSDNSINLNQFYFDRPFVPGEKKKQGNITTQWIARTILTSRYYLPSVVARSIVEDIQSFEFPPIVNAYRMLKKRTESLEAALASKDTRQVQQLLHGSLIVTVNEGPEKIAEAFLTGPESKEKQKLRAEFKKMLKVLKIGVKFHGEWVTNNNEFVPLQVQLEDNLAELTVKMEKIDLSLVK